MPPSRCGSPSNSDTHTHHRQAICIPSRARKTYRELEVRRSASQGVSGAIRGPSHCQAAWRVLRVHHDASPSGE